MSLKLAFEAFRVFIRTERLSVRAGTFLVHMAWVFFVAMLLWCGGFFSQHAQHNLRRLRCSIAMM